MNKIKVLHLTFDMALGGTEQVIRQIVLNTESLKVEHTIICLDGKIGELGQLLKAEDITVERFYRKSGLDFKLIKELRRYINKNNVDILHCHQYTPYVYGVLASIFTKAKVIFTEHGRFYPDTYKWKRWLINPILSFFTKEIVAISKATADALVQYENFSKRRIKVIYNGIGYENTSSPSDQILLKNKLGININCLIFGTISRLDPIKNQKLMIASFSQVVKEYNNCRLLIIGDGPMMRELVELTEYYQIKEQVIFTGFIINPQHYLAIMDVFLLTSFSEGTSMTLLEAMAYLTPIIVTSVGGNPEIINSQCGMMVESDNKEQLIQAMIGLVDSISVRKKLAQQAKLRYELYFTEKKMIANYMNLYES